MRPDRPDLAPRSPVFGYRGRLLTLAGLAVAWPLALFAGYADPFSPIVAAGFAGSGLALAALAYQLRPIRTVSAALRGCAGAAEPTSRDEARQMVADVQDVAGALEAMRERLARRHPTTGLPTREPFLAAIGGDPAKTGVLGIVRLADYDHLAAFDQGCADRVIKAFAERLTTAVGPGRPIAQVDRDCFAIWFDDIRSRDVAGGELQSVAYVLAQDLNDGDLRITPEVGVGAAVYPIDATDPQALLTRAFAALARDGRGEPKLNFFSPGTSDAARERFVIEQGLRAAISRDEFQLEFQPLFDASVGGVTGAEALIRWRHPELGQVSPARFVPILEQSGLMEEVGLWVLNAACRQARAWRDQGFTGLTMAVNLSPRQCRDPGFTAKVTRTLERHGLPPAALELELTETAAMEDADRTRTLLGELLSLGVGVAIDDFGAGYSSLTYLKNLPFSKLKIDREFVDHVDQRRDSQAICSALIELARGLGITVLAEGVERREELDALFALGCPMFQGFFIAPPMSSAAFAARLKGGDWPVVDGPSEKRRLRA